MTLEVELGEVRSLCKATHVEEAEEKLRLAIRRTDPLELARSKEALGETLKAFFPKRRKRLEQALAERLKLGPERPTPSPPPPSPPPTRSRLEQIDALGQRLHQRLESIARSSIFQWNTGYRPAIPEIFDDFLAEMTDPPGTKRAARLVFTEFERHARDIFDSGYRYQVNVNRMDKFDAIRKNLNGLDRFLEIPIERYSVLLADWLPRASATALRDLTSAALRGILTGFARAQFDGRSGRDVLSTFHDIWLGRLPFLNASDLNEATRSCLDPDLCERLLPRLAPLAVVLDELVEAGSKHDAFLPGLSSFEAAEQRISVSLPLRHPGNRKEFILISCYLDPRRISTDLAAVEGSRGADLLFLPLPPELRDWAQSDTTIRSLYVDTAEGRWNDSARKRALAALEFQISQSTSGAGSAAPLTRNFALEFPLDSPRFQHYFRVSRGSVLQLVQRMEDRTGIVQWCSVRRSGKTTAVMQVGESTAKNLVVAQTCLRSAQTEDSEVLFREIASGALERQDTLPSDFFEKALAKCIGAGALQERKVILLLDEYETLFEKLSAQARRNPSFELDVAIPLLNQLVQFSTRHLLVLVGQEPDAHFILMRRNPLSAYVKQETFPLFEHGASAGHSEFVDLVQKTVGRGASPNGAFIDALYRETAGHPYLTVCLLREVFDWLIEKQRPANRLQLDISDFHEFQADRLVPRMLNRSEHFGYFRNLARDYLSADVARTSPWLHQLHVLLRALARTAGNTLPRRDAAECLAEAGDRCERPAEPEALISGAALSNFLLTTGEEVRPRIGILSRICGALSS